MNLVFCGTPEFAVPTLAELASAGGFNIQLVVSQPDRPRGRGMEVALTPVKELAVSLGLPVAQPDKLKNNDAFRAQLAELQPDAIAVVAYGRIIPKWMIDLPLLGNINLHASLLPKYRGAAPIQWAIANGESATGVTTMRIDEGLDTGEMLLRSELAIAPEDTALTLSPHLATIGAKLMVETLRGLEAGAITPLPQDDSQATLAPLLEKEDGQIDFTLTATELHNRVRGFQPWPGQHGTFRGKNLRVLRTAVAPATGRPSSPGDQTAGATPALPGALHNIADRLFLTCSGDGSLEILELQLEGKKRMSAHDFINGYNPKPGERLG